MCAKHYGRWQRDEGTDRPRCSIDPCQKPALKRGWCDMHYGRWQRNGDPEKIIVKVRAVCSFGPCDRVSDSHGLCSTHNDQRVAGKSLTEIRAWRSNLERDDQGRKLCRSCLDWLQEDDFGRSSRSPDGLWHICKQCRMDHHRLIRYGLTPDQYDKMLADQGGGCAICGQQCATGRKLAVDHDHSCCPEASRSCGECVRGLLCSACNHGVGKFEDSPERLRRAAEYLECHRG
jgi:hypothetical protein